MEEIWKDIKGWEGYYQVSNTGRFKSLARIITRKDKKHGFVDYPIKERIKALRPESTGYFSVSLSRDQKDIGILTHRLVAQAFIPNPENKPEVNHKDGNKANSCVDNLEWVTHKENLCHASETGLLSRNERNPLSVPTIQLTLDGRYVKEWPSVSQIHRSLGFHAGSICNCFTGRQRTAHGFKWISKQDYERKKE